MISMIQAYRGLAAFFVLTHHCTLLSRDYFNVESRLIDSLYGGTAGVQFFFVLSGFIIFYAHKNDIGKIQTVKTYARKRFVRLYPVYWVVLIMVLSMMLLSPGLGEPEHRGLPSILTSALLLPYTAPPHVSVAWTLTHEILFYTLFAFLIASRSIGTTVLLTWFLLILFYWHKSSAFLYPLNFLLAPINLLFGLGIVCAFANEYYFRKLSNAFAVWSLFAIGNIVVITAATYLGLARFDDSIELDYNLFTIIFGIGTLCIVATAGSPYIEVIFVRRKMLVFLGAASYSLYLIHYPIVVAAGKIIRYLELHLYLNQYLLYVILVLSGLIGGMALYQFVEKPLLTYLSHRPKRAS